ncbi:MAG: hypothetical protein ACO3LB_08575 [Flavobacteriaceae bacterium]|jgi:hypothetical protein
MIVQLYKPNPRNTGCAFSCDIGSSNQKGEPCVYVRAVRQFSWDDKKKTGSFSQNSKNPEASISIKLNEVEIGGLINAIENHTEFSAYHSYEDNKTQISFKLWERQGRPNAFSFGIIRNSTNKFGIGVEMSEAYCLLEFFKFSLQELYAYRMTKNEEIKSRQ